MLERPATPSPPSPPRACGSRRIEHVTGELHGSSRCRRRSGQLLQPDHASWSGSVKRNVLPAPGRSRPRAGRRAARRTCVTAAGRGRSPRAGSPSCRACSNSSKIRSWSSGAMPGPVSATATSTTPSVKWSRDVDAPVRRRELDGVRQQVEHDLAELPLVRLHDDLRRATSRPNAIPPRLARSPCIVRPLSQDVGHETRRRGRAPSARPRSSTDRGCR